MTLRGSDARSPAPLVNERRPSFDAPLLLLLDHLRAAFVERKRAQIRHAAAPAGSRARRHAAGEVNAASGKIVRYREALSEALRLEAEERA